jgi:hypothetical protein
VTCSPTTRAGHSTQPNIHLGGRNNEDLEWLAGQIQQYHTINVQALCDVFYMPVANMMQHYCIGYRLNKSELIAKIQTVTSRTAI